MAAFAVAFFCVTSLTIFSTRFSGGLALVWFGSALLAALLVTLPRSRWPGAALLFGLLSTFATSLFGFGPAVALPLAAINVAEGATIAVLLRRMRPEDDYLEHGWGVTCLLVATLAGVVVTALPAGLLVSQIVDGPWHAHARDWIVAHGLGTLLAFPLALLFARGTIAHLLRKSSSRDHAELLVTSLFSLSVAAASFFQSTYPLLFLPIVPLSLASFRLGRIGASVTVLLIAFTASVSLAAGRGSFADLAVSLPQKALFLQFYLAVMLLMSLPVAVALRHRETLNAEVKKREALQRLISDHSDDALLSLDAGGIIRFASPAGIELSGLARLDDQPLSVFFSENDRALIERTLAKASQAFGQTQILERSVMRARKTMWLEAKVRAVAGRGDSVSCFVVTIRDVTVRKKEELRAAQEARTDALTGLPNRRAFLKMLEPALEIAQTRPLSLAIVDLDNFKRINDDHGHDTGDVVLRQVAGVMRKFASRNCFFARLGGEEFALLAWHEAMEDTVALCENLRHEIDALNIRNADGVRFGISASIGLARIAEPCSASLALQAADGPLYAAKAAGRNNVQVASVRGSWGIPAGDVKAEAARAHAA